MREKIKYLLIGVLVAGAIWFLYSTYKQIQTNRKNIEVIAQFLSQPRQTQAVPVKPPVEEKEDAGK